MLTFIPTTLAKAGRASVFDVDGLVALPFTLHTLEWSFDTGDGSDEKQFKVSMGGVSGLVAGFVFEEGTVYDRYVKLYGTVSAPGYLSFGIPVNSNDGQTVREVSIKYQRDEWGYVEISEWIMLDSSFYFNPQVNIDYGTSISHKFYSYSQPYNSHNVWNIQGPDMRAIHSTNGSANSVIGSTSMSTSTSIGDVGTMKGFVAMSLQIGSGNVSENIALEAISGRVNASGVTTDDYTFIIRTPQHSSNLTNHYGMYIEDQSFGTDNYSIYVAGSSKSFINPPIEFNGIVRNTKGDDIASANIITIPNNGNFFAVTGNTRIDLITDDNVVAGTTVILKFQSSITVKNGQTPSGNGKSIAVSGGADINLQAGTIASLVYDGVVWDFKPWN